jgi:hypothetical protein
MKTLMKPLVIAAMSIATLAPAKAFVGPDSYPVNVPFFQAAIFFMFGKEGKDVTYEQENLNDGGPHVERKAGAPRITERALVRDNWILTGKGAVSGVWEVVMFEGKPCIIYASLLSPQSAFNTINFMTGDGNGGRRLEFNKLPSPRAFISRGNWYWAALPHETWCSFRQVVEDGKIKLLSGSSTCRTDIGFEANEQMFRRINALDYIRTNYCQGQPEPAPQPRMPY